MKRILLYAVAIATPLAAQAPCPESSSRDNGKRAHHCEIREYTVADTGRFSADSGQNGGIKVTSADRSNVLIRARVQTSAQTAEAAKALSGQIRVQAAPGSVSAEGPAMNRESGWGVSYEVVVPRQSGLTLKAHNGGLSISDVEGEITFETTNGGVRLERLAGNVQGRTVNGGVRVELAGNTWRGNRLDVVTTNGGIRVAVPDGYSAQFEAATTNGGVHAEFPGVDAAQVKRDRRVSLTLGSGGPLVRLVTTNGGVHLNKS
jgi:DUF4097 and DUF4098 domain-containing protein YvlB